jgi:alkylated DNA nucleotide flippase Atl1
LGALGRLPVKEVLNIAWVPLLFIGVFFLLLPCHSHAFKGDFEAGKRSGGMRGEARDRGLESERSWIQETGLTPVFPEGFRCASISSPFASRFDGAGNRRTPTIHGGKHGGVDIGFQVGHPEVSMANGEIIAKGPAEGDGAQMEGIFLWMRHSPQDTGLPFWVFNKYQHLKELPSLEVGARIKAGDVVAIGGDTGTYSRKFGVSLPHLHVSTFIAEHGDFRVLGRDGNLVKVEESLHVDMMALFVKGITLETAKENPSYTNIEKTLQVAVVDSLGGRSDPNAKIVWPVVCNFPQ